MTSQNQEIIFSLARLIYVAFNSLYCDEWPA